MIVPGMGYREIDVELGTTVLDIMLQHINELGKYRSVHINGAVVPPSEWSTTFITDTVAEIWVAGRPSGSGPMPVTPNEILQHRIWGWKIRVENKAFFKAIHGE